MSRKRTTAIPPEVQHMADRVYMLRHAKRLTQSALAQAAGCSTATISDLETKKLGTVDIANLVALARVLETTPNELLGWDTAVTASVAPSTPPPPRPRRAARKAVGDAA